jgi:hypothetical protein
MEHMNPSPLFLEGWLEFNRLKWGFRPLRVKCTAQDSAIPAGEIVLYLDKSGKIVQPRLNPYLPIGFQSTPTENPRRLYPQWLAVATQLVREMRKRGLRGTVTFPPDIADVRPWQWAGFRASVRYTFHVHFPFDYEVIDKAAQRRIRKAQKAGYTCRRTTNMVDVLACLQETEQRQGFRHGLTTRDLECASELLGADQFRAYVCYAPDGEAAAVEVNLHCRGAAAVHWVAGNKQEHLFYGAAQCLRQFVFQDLEQAGASGIDLAGANIPSIAQAKTAWGGRLVPFYSVETYSARSVAKWVRDWSRFMRAGSM